MIKETRIYVPIEKSGIERLMPVAAIHLPGDIYLIAAQPYDRLSEKWTFPPGTTVRCQKIVYAHQEVQVAIEAAALPTQLFSKMTD